MTGAAVKVGSCKHLLNQQTLIRYYVEESSELLARERIENTYKCLEKKIIKKEYQNLEKYWKIEGTYLVEVILELNDNISELQNYLENIADYWIEFGNPVEELLASRTDKNCNFMKEKFIMVDVIL